MSGTLPTTPSFQTLNISSETNTSSTTSVSGRVQRKTQGVQRWSFTASYAPGSRVDFAPLMGFITKQQGAFGSFTAKLPEYSDTAGSLVKGTHTMLVNNASGYALGAKAMVVDVKSPVFEGVALKAGDFIGLANHNKVYQLVEDCTLNASGDGFITFEPGLVSTVVDNEQVVVFDVQFTCKLTSDAQEFMASNGDQVRYELDIVEDV